VVLLLLLFPLSRTRGIAPVPQGGGGAPARPAIYLRLLTSYRIVCAQGSLGSS